MKRTIKRILTLAGMVTLPLGIADADEHEFTIAVVPDIQTYTALRPQILEAQIQWIIDNRDAENIIYVSQLGDLKDVGTGSNGCINGIIAWPGPSSPTSTEWEIVRRAFDQLDTAGIPYGFAPGNHDFDSLNYPLNSGGCPNFSNQRPLVGYNLEFPPSSFPGTNYDSRTMDSNEYNYVTVSSNGVDFIFINLGYHEEAPAEGNTPGIDWAETQLQSFPNHLAIITSHNLVDCNKAPARPQISGNGPCAITPETFNQLSTYGANIIDRLRGYQNLFMLIGGHRFGEAYDQLDRTDLGFPPVHAVLANYQHLRYSPIEFDDVRSDGPPAGSSGFFKVMEFDMDDLTVDLVSLSPAIPAHDGFPSTGPDVSPVLSSAERAAVVRSPRDRDANDLAANFNIDDNTRNMHDRSISNLRNISFANYVTIAPPGPEPFVVTGSRANDAFFRFLGNVVIPEAEVVERCSDGDGCLVSLTRTYGGTTTVESTNFAYDPATRLFQLLTANGSLIRTGINANGFTDQILGPQANTFCWFSDWDTSGTDATGDQNGNFAGIIWNNTATNLTCTIRIDD